MARQTEERERRGGLKGGWEREGENECRNERWPLAVQLYGRRGGK